MSRYPSESDRLQAELADVAQEPFGATWAIKSAQRYTLHTAMGMLQAQILSRRAMIGTGALTVEATDQTAREVQQRVERIRLIVAELRSRGEVVEWEE